MLSLLSLSLIILSLTTATTLNSLLEDNELRPRTNTKNCLCGTWCCTSLNHHCGYVQMAGGWSCFPNDKSATSLILGPTSIAAPISSTRTPSSTTTLASSLSKISSQAVATPPSSEITTITTALSTLATTTSSRITNTISSLTTTSTSPNSSSPSRFSFSSRKYFTVAIATSITVFLLFS